MSDKAKHLSASSIAAFKNCPTRYRLGYVEGIRQLAESKPLRFGTAWHKGLEVLGTPLVPTLGSAVVELAQEPGNRDRRTLTTENRLELAVEAATAVYQDVPAGVDPTEWAVEREVVANALAAYHWYYGEDKNYKIVATEMLFELPVVNPETGRSTPNYVRVGKIDRIVQAPDGRLLIGENKTTSKPIGSDSTYWNRLRLDTQSKYYIMAARHMQWSAKIPGTENDPAAVSGLMHDVFHKPQISPKKLTQAESAEFVKTSEYCGQKFERNIGEGQWAVDGVPVEIEYGAEPKAKKDGTVPARAFAIRETPSMFGARLLQAMTQEPEKYFARREIVFTDQELRAFEAQVWALQRSMQEMENSGNWFQNESSCEATFRCQYCPICYNNVACCDGKTVPPGFKRLHAEIETTSVETE